MSMSSLSLFAQYLWFKVCTCVDKLIYMYFVRYSFLRILSAHWTCELQIHKVTTIENRFRQRKLETHSNRLDIALLTPRWAYVASFLIRAHSCSLQVSSGISWQRPLGITLMPLGVAGVLNWGTFSACFLTTEFKSPKASFHLALYPFNFSLKSFFFKLWFCVRYQL